MGGGTTDRQTEEEMGRREYEGHKDKELEVEIGGDQDLTWAVVPRRRAYVYWREERTQEYCLRLNE